MVKRRTTMQKSIFTILLFLIINCFTLEASIYGVLKGKVVDNEGNPVIGASILVEGTNRGTYVKERDGSFTIVNIVAGKYTILVRAVGFADYRAEVFISADQTTTINVKMLPKDIALQEIVVRDTRLVDKTAIGPVKSVKSEDITNIPVTNVQAVVGYEAGVFNAAGGYNIRGSRTTETQIKVDGVDVGNQFTGGFGIGGLAYTPTISRLAVEEMQVIVGNFSAEYGNALGGIVNTIAKTGRTDRYEGFFSWQTDVEPLYGSQSKGIQVIREGDRGKVIEGGPGKKALSTQENLFEFGFGGPLPLLDRSTFFISTKYQFEKYRGASYEIYDPLGNNLSRMPHNGTWVRNITGRMRFGISSDISLILGGSYGVTSYETSALGWLYANDEGIFYDTSATGEITTRYNGIPERMAKQNVGNQFVTNIMARINHTLSSSSFYEFTVSFNTNSDEIARRTSYGAPNFFTGFDLLIPQDNWRFTGVRIEPGKDRVVDYYQSLSMLQTTKDGYLPDKDILQPNPFTGYIETGINTTGTNNAWGLANTFVTHGSVGFSFRNGNYWQLDGAYTNVFQTSEFSHNFKTGFELRLYTMRLHSNGNPTSDEPFYDVYSDRWGGNIYAENEEVYKKTSQPQTPTRLGLYVQDQVTYKGIIFTPGLRFDYFNPNSKYRLPSQTFIPITADTGFADAPAKVQFSPRINVSYPITERSLIRINYGIYFKMPDLQYFYDGFYKFSLRGNELLGEPNLDVERANSYDIAYSNQLSDDFAFDVNAYYKDIYNQLGIQYVATTPTPYFQYTVAEYGNAKGLEFSLRKRATPQDHFGFRANYTLSSVVGTSTASGSNYNPPTDPFTGDLVLPLVPYPLGYDRTHTATLILDFIWGDNQGPSIGGVKFLQNTFINLTGTFSTGTPYTRFEPGGKAISEINAERNPSRWNINAKITKRFLMKDIFGEAAGRSAIDLFVDILNLTNRFAPLSVYNTSGDPDDNNISLNRRPGDFGSIPFYREANYGIAETYNVTQYDSFGNRLYNELSDHDRNGVVTQYEKYESYMRYIETLLSFRGLYSFPRQVRFGILINF